MSEVADLSSIKEFVKQVGSILGKNGLNLLVAIHDNMETTGPKEMQDYFHIAVTGPIDGHQCNTASKEELCTSEYINKSTYLKVAVTNDCKDIQ